MGFRIDIEGMRLEASDYSLDESSSPLSAGDSTGSVGSFTVTVPIPDPDIPLATNLAEDLGFGYGVGPYGAGPYGGLSGETPVRNSPWLILRELGPQILLDKSIRVFDSRKGFTLGTITGSNLSLDGGNIQLSGVSRLSQLNVYGIQAEPFIGTLEQAFEYYLDLADISTGLFVDSSVASRPVVFPGWAGELWYYLKMMAAAQDCDISLVSGIILLRPIRVRVATTGRDMTRSISAGSNTLAQSVEIYLYNNRPITDELVYPPGGWSPEVEVLNVNAGETSEYTLELSASLSSLQSPVMQTFVSETHSSSSVYTVVAEDGLPVSPQAWSDYGGSLTVEISPETNTLLVTLVGPEGLPLSSGSSAAQNFSIALGSDTTGNRYSTLRLVGTGVAYDRVKKRVRTGVPASRTSTEVGVTIDNPFISTVNDLYRTGTRAAKQYAGASLTLSGSVTALNRRGDSGQATYPTYGDVQLAISSELGAGASYADVEGYYASLSLTTYSSVQAYWFEEFQDDNIDQVFGNAQGARVWDAKTRRWYRVRNANLSPASIGIQTADDDLIFEDVSGYYAGQTYESVQSVLDPFDYREVEMLGLWGFGNG